MRTWIQRRKKSLENLKKRSSKDLNFKEREENYIRNGGRVLEESISLFHGRTNSIRHFSVDEINCMNAKQQVHYVGVFHGLYQGSWEGRVVLVYKTCYDFNTQVSECVCQTVRQIVIATKMAAHNNAHKLIGCCLETKCPVLVYEWIKAGSLDDYIILKDRDRNQQLLEWKDRLRIAWELSHVVSYLHTAFPRPIIYRDLTPSHVFLDENYGAKLLDFSFSVSLPEGKEVVEECIAGTMGYSDPEYLRTGNVAESTDVYSFGILLLVLITGKMPFDFEQQGAYKRTFHLVKWLQLFIIKDNIIREIVDPSITANGVTAIEALQLRASIQLALFCIAYEPDTRPTMVEVATALKSMIASPESIPTITKFQLPRINMYDIHEAQNSEEIIDVEQETRSLSEALVEQAHSSNNSTNNSSFEDQVVDQVQYAENTAKRTNKDDLKDKRLSSKELLRSLSSKPLQLLISPKHLKDLPYSCKELHDLMALQPHGTSIRVGFLANIFQYHDTQDEVEVYVTTQDVVQLLSMQRLDTSCFQIFMRYLHIKCKLLKSASIGFMCPKRLAMAKMHLIYTSQYLHYAITELQTKSYVLAPYFQGTHWTLIVICPQRHVVLFFDPTGKNLDGLVIQRCINMAYRICLQSRGFPDESLTWRLVQCPRQVNEADCGYYVMRYMYEIVIVTLYHQTEVNLEECFTMEPYNQQQINEVRDIWARYFIDECI